MNFQRTGLYAIESKEGYRVNAVKVAGVWVYHAHGPKRKQVRDGRIVVAVIDPIKGRIDSKVRYERGDEMPFSRESLGTFRADNYASQEEAKDAAVVSCEQHHALVLQLHEEQQDTGEKLAGPSGIASIRVRSTAENL